ncbi:MAG: HEAT repeat domain-containing protein [Ignavibacteria bacterium]|nr:MAG: HEAT repeat domain-containing protein [Ignavibacteria bacterium]
MKTDDDENVILACIEALGNIKSEKSVAHLVRLYSVNELFVPSIIEALGKIGSDVAIDFIMESYKTDDELIKYSIVESLGNIGNPQSFYFLLSELKNLTGPMSWAAVEAIYKLSSKYNLEVPFEESFKNKILDTLYEADPQFKKSALALVIGYEDKEIFDAFLSVLGSDYEIDEMVKEKLLNNVDATIKGIHKRLDEKSDNIASLLALLEEMCEIHGLDFNQYFQPLERQAFLDSLAAALELPIEEARKSAMNLLFKISPDYAFLFLDKMLADDNLWNRLFVLDILEGYSLGEEELSILSGIADKSDDMVRERIIDLVEYNRNQLSTQN